MFFHFGVKEIYRESVCKEKELAVPLKNYFINTFPPKVDQIGIFPYNINKF